MGPTLIRSRARTAVGQGVDWARVIDRAGLGAYLFIAGMFSTWWVFVFTYWSPQRLFVDAHVYYRATAAWLAGADPWAASTTVPFAAPPPALLLNLPLQPLGEQGAVAFWVIGTLISIVILFRRLHLPWWMLIFTPLVEGTLSGSPDIVLAAMVVIGAGGISAIAKPYAIPTMLSDGHWRAVALAVVLGAASLFVLPWRQFFAAQHVIGQAFTDWTTIVSAFGSPLLMVVTAIALASLGPRTGLALFTPGLLAQQPHYLVFSLQAISRSRLLAIFMTVSLTHWAAFGVIAFAVAQRLMPSRVRLQGPADRHAGPRSAYTNVLAEFQMRR